MENRMTSPSSAAIEIMAYSTKIEAYPFKIHRHETACSGIAQNRHEKPRRHLRTGKKLPQSFSYNHMMGKISKIHTSPI